MMCLQRRLQIMTAVAGYVCFHGLARAIYAPVR